MTTEFKQESAGSEIVVQVSKRLAKVWSEHPKKLTANVLRDIADDLDPDSIQK